MVSFLYDNLSDLYKYIEVLLKISGTKTLIIAGKLPEEFPREIPFPQGTKIIGCLVGDDNLFDIIFDVKLSPKQLISFYQKNLGKNWTEHEFLLGERGGFTSSANSSPRKNYTDISFFNQAQEKEITLYVKEYYVEKETITVSLNLHHSNIPIPSLPPLPILPPPSDVKAISPSSQFTEKNYSSETELETSLNLKSLITHYATLFEQVGWIKSKSGQDENSIWQNWRMSDEKGVSWIGFLNITTITDTPRRYLAKAYVSLE